MDATALVRKLADTARVAARTLSVATGDQRRAALLAIAAAIDARSAEILSANEKDMAQGRAAGLNPSLLDRLLLTSARVAGMADVATRPWGELCFYARDPFGNPLCFVDESTLFTGGRFVP